MNILKKKSKMVKSPLNYTGSKYELMPQLLEYFPTNVETFYDVFTGGLSVTINSTYKKIISNDIISPLIQFYKNLKLASNNNNIENEISKIKSFAIDKESQEEYNRIRALFNENNDPYLFFALVASCTNNMMRFNQSFKFNQSFGRRTINDSTIQKLRGYCEILKDKEILFTCYDYKKLFELYSPTVEDFVYFDPPYLISEAGYNCYWSKQHEEGLYDLMDELNSKNIRFVMSNLLKHKGVDNPYINRISKYDIIELDYDYEKVARKKGGDSIEIIVKNF